MSAPEQALDLVLVEIGDPATSSGWMDYTPPDREPAPKELRDAAWALEMQQPQVDSTTGQPFHGLRAVEIETGRYWCFIVQGVGGAFGRAGGCQFVFARVESTDPAFLWHYCTAHVGVNGRIDLSAPPAASSSARRFGPPDELAVMHIREILRALHVDEPYVVLPSQPLENAAYISALLEVLPTREIARRTWWTCAFLPSQAGPRSVSGSLPDQFRESGRRAPIDRMFPPPTPAAEAATEAIPVISAGGASGSAGRTLAEDPVAAAIQLLAVEAVSAEPGPLRRRGKARTMAHLVDAVIADELMLTLDDVELLLEDETCHERLRTPGRLPAVAKFATERAPRAQHALGKHGAETLGPALTEALVTGLAAAEEQQRDGSVLALPPHSEPVEGWHSKLSAALRLILPSDPDAAVARLRTLLIDTGALAQRSEREAAADWLCTLPIDIGRARDLFPLLSRRIAERLRAGKPLDEAVRARLADPADVADPVDELTRIAAELDREHLDALGELLASGMWLRRARGEVSPKRLVGELARAAELGPIDVDALLCCALDRLDDRGEHAEAGTLAEEGAQVLVADGGHPSHDFVWRYLRARARAGNPGDAVAIVLADAAEMVRSATLPRDHAAIQSESLTASEAEEVVGPQQSEVVEAPRHEHRAAEPGTPYDPSSGVPVVERERERQRKGSGRHSADSRQAKLDESDDPATGPRPRPGWTDHPTEASRHWLPQVDPGSVRLFSAVLVLIIALAVGIIVMTLIR